MAGNYEARSFEFDTTDELEDAVDVVAETYQARKETDTDAKVLCMIDDGDEWLQDYDRSPLVIYEDGDPINAAAVSKHDKYYQPVQFDDPLRPLVEKIRDSNLSAHGSITVGKYRKRMTSMVEFRDETVEDPTGNEVELGFKISTAHNGFHAVNIDVGAERLVCTNGMVAWDSELNFTHEHHQGVFRDDLVRQAFDSILNSTSQVEQRFRNASKFHFQNRDELYLALLDCGIEWLFDDPMKALREAFQKELSWHNDQQQMEENPSLYDAYCVGTYAIDHMTSDNASEEAIRTARERLTQLLESYDGSLPNPTEMIANTVETRTDAFSAGSDERWDGEQDLVQTVATSL